MTKLQFIRNDLRRSFSISLALILPYPDLDSRSTSACLSEPCKPTPINIMPGVALITAGCCVDSGDSVLMSLDASTPSTTHSSSPQFSASLRAQARTGLSLVFLCAWPLSVPAGIWFWTPQVGLSHPSATEGPS